MGFFDFLKCVSTEGRHGKPDPEEGMDPEVLKSRRDDGRIPSVEDGYPWVKVKKREPVVDYRNASGKQR